MLLIFMMVACIEPYEFVITDNSPHLVVQAFVSDKSFNETLTYPSDGRYFSVELDWTGDVDNMRATPVTNAIVKLQCDNGEEWTYEQDPSLNGVYFLHDVDFHAEEQKRYKLAIAIEEDIYESAWEMIPAQVPPMGEISFTEGEKQVYKYMANEPVVVNVKIATTQIEIPVNESGEEIFYYWKFYPVWVYRAPNSRSVVLPGHICWITDPSLLSNYQLQLDRSGGYKKDLFWMEAVRNVRLYEDFSALVVQHAMRSDRFYFMRDMLEQNSASFADRPPFNLATNITGVNHSKKVSGYFGVVREQAKRWYFNINDLSYPVENTAFADCNIPTLDPGPECFDCRLWPFGTSVDVKPSWWRN